MNQTWSLDALYSGFDDPRFAADTEKLDRLCGEYRALSESLHTLAPSEALRTALLCEEALTETAEKLLIYAELRQSADTADAQSLSAINRLTAKLSDVTAAQTAFRQYAAALPDLDACIASDPLLTEYGYLLRNLRKDSRYLRSAAEETLFSKLNQSGAAAWENLQAQLTSSVPVSYRGQTITLSAVRNLAYDPEPAVRKEAYEAELACYDRIQDAVAFSLNSIKLQVLNECRLRGFSSPLAQALYKARMQQKTLDAMWSAIGDYLPKFREYLRAKAAALGL
jgi:oligoendopeptidase F